MNDHTLLFLAFLSGTHKRKRKKKTSVIFDDQSSQYIIYPSFALIKILSCYKSKRVSEIDIQ